MESWGISGRRFTDHRHRVIVRAAGAVVVCAGLVARATATEPPAAIDASPPKQILKTDLSDLKVKRIRDATAVIETPKGGLLLVKAGTLLGSQNDKVTSVEQDRIMLSGERLVKGQELKSTVILTWDAEGRVHEQRMETPLRDTEKAPTFARSAGGTGGRETVDKTGKRTVEKPKEK